MSQRLLLMGMMNSRRGVTYLYNEGVENVAWVTGYTAGSAPYNQQSKEATYFYLQTLGTGVKTYVIDTAIDLTSISTIGIDWKNTGTAGAYSCLVASTNKVGSYTLYNARILLTTGAFSRGVNNLDVSGLSGSHYIRIHATSNVPVYSKISAYKVWLE